MAIKRTSKKDGESNKPSEPQKEVRQPEVSNFEHPVITSLSLIRKGGGWVVATIESQGDKILSVKYTEPDRKSIAFERFKITVAQIFVAQDQ